jgi:ABC-type nickel/cobalt efflux system permease component RcnA
MAFIVLFMAGMPCDDTVTAHDVDELMAYDHNQDQSHHDHDHDSSDSDGCSPLCVCHCCHTHVVIPTESISLVYNAIKGKENHTFYKNSNEIAVFVGIWKPPQLI